MEIDFLMKQILKSIVRFGFDVGGLLYILIRMPWNKKRDRWPPRLVWGPVPIMNNKYWSDAMKGAGFESATLMIEWFSSINKKEDFDHYYSGIAGASRNKIVNAFYVLRAPYVVFAHAVNHYDIVHHPFSGGFLGSTGLWRLEAPLLRLAGCKAVLIPYGTDAYQMSKITDTSLRHALLTSYPELAKKEKKIEQRVHYWTRNADAMITGTMIEGIGRWDCAPFNPITIDTAQWQKKAVYSKSNGLNGPVKIIHTPNHRGYKGTEFIVQAVNDLKEEGLDVDLILLENVSNDRVREIMRDEADILVEQIIVSCYALSGIEGMATGLPVLANLENESYTRYFRRHSYLNECPVLSTTPETVKNHLRILVTHPELREELGRAGRLYAEKYHSTKTAQYLFTAIYETIWKGSDRDLMNLFHPLHSKYNRTAPKVRHPLIENRLPEKLFPR